MINITASPNDYSSTGVLEFLSNIQEKSIQCLGYRSFIYLKLKPCKLVDNKRKKIGRSWIYRDLLSMNEKCEKHFHSGPSGPQEVIVFCIAGRENVLGWDFIVLRQVCWEFNKIPQWRKYSFTSLYT